MRNLARLLLFPKRSVRTSEHLMINKECYLYLRLKKEQNKYSKKSTLRTDFVSSFCVLGHFSIVLLYLYSKHCPERNLFERNQRVGKIRMFFQPDPTSTFFSKFSSTGPGSQDVLCKGLGFQVRVNYCKYQGVNMYIIIQPPSQ